jgi:hypothetical protein
VRTVARAEGNFVLLQSLINVFHQFPVDETQFVSLELLLGVSLKTNEPLIPGSDSGPIITPVYAEICNSPSLAIQMLVQCMLHQRRSHVGDCRRRRRHVVCVAEGVWSGMLCRDVELELRGQERTAGEESRR